MAEVSTSADERDEKAGDLEQYLTFMMAGEEYGIDILRVQEIRGWSKPTSIPNAPSYVKGVINLRGVIVPIADLRQRLDLEVAAHGPTTVVIVMRVVHQERSRVIGIVVDAVSDVYNVDVNEIKPPPDFGKGFQNEYTRGIVTLDEKMVLILDVDRLFSGEDLQAVELAA